MADLFLSGSLCFQRRGPRAERSRCPEGEARTRPQRGDLFYVLDLYVLATFIYLFPKGYFWHLLGLLCSKAPFSRISFPLLELQLSFVQPPGEPASRWQFLSDTQLPPDVSAPCPAPLGASIFSFVTLIAG